MASTRIQEMAKLVEALVEHRRNSEYSTLRAQSAARVAEAFLPMEHAGGWSLRIVRALDRHRDVRALTATFPEGDEAYHVAALRSKVDVELADALVVDAWPQVQEQDTTDGNGS